MKRYGIQEMFEQFQKLDDLDKRGFFAFMSGAVGKETFEQYFREYMEMGKEQEG